MRQIAWNRLASEVDESLLGAPPGHVRRRSEMSVPDSFSTKAPEGRTVGGPSKGSKRSPSRLIADVRNKIGLKGTAPHPVDVPAGGSLEMNNNVLDRGPLPSASRAAVRVMEGVGANAVKTLRFTRNTLRNDTHAPLTFVLNWTGRTARMQNNHLDATAVSSSG